jgi:hypothetical protein
MEEAFVAGLSEEELPPLEHQVFIDQLEPRRAAQLGDRVSKEGWTMLSVEPSESTGINPACAIPSGT